jgi:N-acetyl-1-D-myo-inositol-2-amino-2-deoxy-alpha-D-glucopyranoside deacetylase
MVREAAGTVDCHGEPLRLMLVHAHPDDETTTTGATIAQYVAQGVAVTLVTGSRGDRGEIVDQEIARLLTGRPDGQVGSDPVLAGLLGVHRAGELTLACRALGIADARFLGGPGRWWDSGMAGDPPSDGQTFSGGDPAAQTLALVRLLREVRPQVVVTYDERGGYGHPDHIRAHDITAAAVGAAADPAYPADQAPADQAPSDPAPSELAPWTVAKLYAAVVPDTTLGSLATLLAATPFEGPNPFAGVPAEIPDGASLPFGVPVERITARIDARAWLPAKLAAMREHRSQMNRDGWFFAVAAATGDGLGVEHYQLLRGERETGPDEVEDDLFAGVRAVPDNG